MQLADRETLMTSDKQSILASTFVLKHMRGETMSVFALECTML